MDKTLIAKIEEMKNKFPAKRNELSNLFFENHYRKEESLSQFYTYLTLTWGSIFLWTSSNGPLPFFREYGRIFKTHRVFRHYAYSFALIWAVTQENYRRNINTTVERLENIEKMLSKEDDGYVKPTKPISYNFKM